MPLTDTAIRKLKPGAGPIKLSDGGGLHLCVTETGSKLWRMAYRFAGKQKLLSFGAYPAVSLSAARKRRDQAKELLAADIDPGVRTKAEKHEREVAGRNTFASIADEFLQKAEREGRADVTVAKKRWLLGMAKASFGTRPIRDITAADILVPLKKVERAGNLETAKRLRASIGQVFRYAIATARADVDLTYGLRGAIAAPSVTHRAALTEADDFARLVRAVWAYEGQPETRIALQLMTMVYPRPGELRQAKWSEFDLDRGTWDRMLALAMPAASAEDAFKACNSTVKGELKTRLVAATGAVNAASLDLAAAVAAGTVHAIVQHDLVGGQVTKKEMTWLYNTKMSKAAGSGRRIYEEIRSLAPHGRCPLCCHRQVSTLDHYLPKALYPALAVAPLNLIPSCFDCNWAKRTVAPTSASDVPIHPYFDDLDNNRWLRATVLEVAPAAVQFFVAKPALWTDQLADRVVNQFDVLGLGRLYGVQAADMAASIRQQLGLVYQAGGAVAVREELLARASSDAAIRPNRWQTSAFEAMAESDWFCVGGFAAQ